MMDSGARYQLEQEHLRESLRKGKNPRIIPATYGKLTSAEKLAWLQANSVPFIGERRIVGFVPTDTKLFVLSIPVLSSGPALSQQQFANTLTPGKAYGIVNMGEFQVYVQEYEVHTTTRQRYRKPAKPLAPPDSRNTCWRREGMPV